jgi:hypothetical protein
MCRKNFVKRLLLVFPLAALATFSAKAEGLSVEQTKSAQSLYTTKCSKCHELYNPSVYSEQSWTRRFQKMTKKAKLQPTETELLNRYLTSLRAPAKPTAPILWSTSLCFGYGLNTLMR